MIQILLESGLDKDEMSEYVDTALDVAEENLEEMPKGGEPSGRCEAKNLVMTID